MKNIRMELEYDGTGFSGWQRQTCGVPTIQGTIETVLGRILQEEVRINGAGRTDRGVHARGQAASFSTSSTMDLKRLLYSSNTMLPQTVRIKAMKEVEPAFHARFSATAREYRYFLLEQPSAIDGRFAGCCHGRPDRLHMNRLASMIVGEHDFSAFAKDDPQLKNHLCTVSVAEWYRYRHFHVFRIVANRFLRSMVRFLAAGMIASATGRLEEGAFGAMLSGGSRNARLVPADASGLFLWKVSYER